MKKLFKLSMVSLGCLLFAANDAQATSYQIFPNINFSNPAALNSVKKDEFIVGGTGLFNTFHFSGTAAGVDGTASSNQSDFLPYGRIATRISPKVVVGLDITQPYYTDIKYSEFSIVNMFATQTVIRDTNISPKLSYQVNNRLAVGVGFDANDLYDAQLNFSVPPLGNLTNKASSWAYGWDVGLFYVITPATFLNLSYYSKIVQHAEGVSEWGPISNNSLSADVKLPATFIINLIQMMSPRWAMSGTVRYAQWDTLRYTVIQNTALGSTVTVPALFYNNISAELATRYQINDKWAGVGAFDYEPNVQPTWTRNVGLPTYTRYYPAVGAEYELAKGVKTKLIYAYIYMRAPINMTNAVGNLRGTEHMHAHAFDVSLTYDI